MKIYGFMLVKDEADIVGQALESLCRHGGFEKIFVFDNGSSDDTAKVASRFTNRGVVVQPLPVPFSDNLKFETAYRHAHLMQTGDWFAVLDADEIYQESLPAYIEKAEREGANCIATRIAQFYFTDKDASYDFDPAQPAELQRPYYLVNYGEPKIYRYDAAVQLTADRVKRRDPVLKIATAQLLEHHFQFRSAQQTQRRLDVRLANHGHSGNWGHVNSKHWRDYIVPAQYLHRFDGTVKTGLPQGANLYKIPDNAAYQGGALLWMKKNDQLTAGQLHFFEAGRIERLLRKLF